MRKRSIVPRYPKSFQITQQLQKNLNGWVEYFRNLSPRIKLILPNDKDFLYEEFERRAKIEALRDDDVLTIQKTVLDDWPTREQIAFIVCVDLSYPGQPPHYLVGNTYIFCYRNWAFGLGYFQAVSEYVGVEGEERPDDWEYVPDHYSLQDYSDSALSWEYVRTLIVACITEHESQISEPPEEQSV